MSFISALMRRPASANACFAFACLVGGALISVWMGQDANWDLLNYHFYNGAALLNGRFDHDLVASGMQSSLNPLLDAVYAWLALGPLHAHPRWLAAAMGLWFGLVVYLAARLARILHPQRWCDAATATALAATGVAVVSQIGATTDELAVAAIMLAGLVVLLRENSVGAVSIFIAGALFGAAAGLKLTAVAYAPAGCLAAASLMRRPRRMVAACLLFGSAWLAALLVVDGWWGWRLYARFGSPTFPMFNGVFRSPLYPPVSFIDERFFPRGLLQWLFYPLYWLSLADGGAQPSELPFRDPRGAVALCLGLAATVSWALKLRRGREPIAPPVRAALVFVVVGYVAWLATSSILRYAVVVEVVACLLIPRLVSALLPRRIAALGSAALLVAVVFATRDPEPGRVPYGPEVVRADMDWVAPGDLLVLTFRGAVSYLVATMKQQRDVDVLNVGDTVLEARGWVLHDAFVRRIQAHNGRIVVVTMGDPQLPFPELGEIGLDPSLSHCTAIGVALGARILSPGPGGVNACVAQKRDPPALRSGFWAEAAARYRNLAQMSSPSDPLIGWSYLRAAGAAARGTRFLDWTDLLWNGVRGRVDPVAAPLDASTLYVLSPGHALDVAARLNPAHDVLGRVDGFIVAAPGWRDCTSCAMPESLVRADFAPLLTLGEPYEMRQGARGSHFLQDGWWPGEPVAVWSGATAELVLPVAGPLPDRLTLRLAGAVFTAPGFSAQRLLIDVAGHPDETAAARWAGSGEMRLALRRNSFRRVADDVWLLPLRLTLPDAASPSHFGVSSDPRRLGVTLRSLSLESDGPVP